MITELICKSHNSSDEENIWTEVRVVAKVLVLVIRSCLKVAKLHI